MQQDHGAVMGPGQQLGKCLVPGGLAVVVPVCVSKTPKDGFIAQFLGHLQIGLAVNALGRAVEFGQLLAGDFLE